jgi:hypothetical protein
MSFLMVLALFSPIVFVLFAFAIQSLPFGVMQQWEEAAAEHPKRSAVVQMSTAVAASALMASVLYAAGRLSVRYETADRLLLVLLRTIVPLVAPGLGLGTVFLPLFAGRHARRGVRLALALFADLCFAAGMCLLPEEVLTQGGSGPSTLGVLFLVGLAAGAVLATWLAVRPPHPPRPPRVAVTPAAR